MLAKFIIPVSCLYSTSAVGTWQAKIIKSKTFKPWDKNKGWTFDDLDGMAILIVITLVGLIVFGVYIWRKGRIRSDASSEISYTGLKENVPEGQSGQSRRSSSIEVSNRRKKLY